MEKCRSSATYSSSTSTKGRWCGLMFLEIERKLVEVSEDCTDLKVLLAIFSGSGPYLKPAVRVMSPFHVIMLQSSVV